MLDHGAAPLWSSRILLDDFLALDLSLLAVALVCSLGGSLVGSAIGRRRGGRSPRGE